MGFERVARSTAGGAFLFENDCLTYFDRQVVWWRLDSPEDSCAQSLEIEMPDDMQIDSMHRFESNGVLAIATLIQTPPTISRETTICVALTSGLIASSRSVLGSSRKLLRNESAIHRQDRAGEETGMVARQVGKEARHFLCRGNATNRMSVHKPLDEGLWIRSLLGRPFDDGSIHRSQGNRVDSDSILGVLDRHLSRQLMNGPFRWSVRALILQSNMTGDRACVQNESPLLLHHDGNNLTSRPEHGFDIRIHDPIPFCLGVLMNRLDDTCTGVIHHDIYSPKTRNRRLGKLLSSGFETNIASHVDQSLAYFS